MLQRLPLIPHDLTVSAGGPESAGVGEQIALMLQRLHAQVITGDEKPFGTQTCSLHARTTT